MSKLLTHLRPSVLPANTFLSQNVHTGPPPSGISGPVNGAVGDEFVNGGDRESTAEAPGAPTSMAARVQPSDDTETELGYESLQGGSTYRLRLSHGSTLTIPLGADGEITSASMELYNYEGSIMYGDGMRP